MKYDFHTHLYLYKKEETFLEELKAHDIFSVTSSVDIQSWEKDQNIERSSPNIISTFGIHPSRANQFARKLKDLDQYIKISPIIGEIGLDKRWCPDIDFEAQKIVFEYLVQACSNQNKFCVVHTAGAEEQCLKILKSKKCSNVIIHWYDGPMDVFKSMVQERWYFTFSPALKYSQTLGKLLELVPADRILSETDGPETEAFLGGTGRSPSILNRVIEDMARIRKLSVSEMEIVIEENSLRVLRESGISI